MDTVIDVFLLIMWALWIGVMLMVIYAIYKIGKRL